MGLIWDNLVIEPNLIEAAPDHDVRLLFLGSSCIFPKFAQRPIRGDSLLTGTLAPTNEPHTIARIAGVKLCESFNRQVARKTAAPCQQIFTVQAIIFAANTLM